MNIILRAIQKYTKAEYLARKNNDVCRLLNRFLNTCDVCGGTEVPQTLQLPHSGQGVILCTAKGNIGENVVIYPHTLVGLRDIIHSKLESPRLGNNVIIGTGCIIVGDITIGDNSVIGANSYIDKDIPPNSIAYTEKKLVVKPRKK